MIERTALYMSYMLPGGQSDWRIRRLLVFLCVFFCMGLIIWAAGWMRPATADTVITQSFWFLTFVVGYYVFGPIIDDKIKNRGVMAPPAPGTANPPQPPEVQEQGSIPLDPSAQPQGTDDPLPVGRGAGM